MNKLKSTFTIILAVAIFGCGNKEKKEKEIFSYDEPIEASTVNETVEQDNSSINIMLVANDLMKFDLSEIKVKAGQKVKLTLRHKGKLDVNVMGHNFVLLKQGVDVPAFALKAATARDNKYIPKDTEDVIVHTDIIGGGQTTSIEFKAPETGVYDFICSFPAHYAIMKGKFIVE